MSAATPIERQDPGSSAPDFVVPIATDPALPAIEQIEVARLSSADQACLVQAVLTPPAPNPALLRAFARRDALLRADA